MWTGKLFGQILSAKKAGEIQFKAEGALIAVQLNSFQHFDPDWYLAKTIVLTDI